LTTLAGFDICFDLTRDLVRRQILSQARLSGNALNPPFELVFRSKIGAIDAILYVPVQSLDIGLSPGTSSLVPRNGDPGPDGLAELVRQVLTYSHSEATELSDVLLRYGFTVHGQQFRRELFGRGLAQ
jgi:hypothetical protein